jgi:hypothetical protein
MLEYYDQHHMIARITDLYQRHTTMARDELRDHLIQWDNDQGRAMQHSENGRRHYGTVHSFAPTGIFVFESLLDKKTMYLLFSDGKPNFNTTNPRSDFRTSALCSPSSRFVNTSIEPTASFGKTKASRFLFVSKPTTIFLLPMRTTWNATKTESRRKARIVQNALDGESTRNTYSYLRRIVKSSEQSSLTKMKIPMHTDSTYRTLQEQSANDLIWDTVVDRQDIERHIASYNRDSFRAASESSYGHGIIHDALTYTSLSPAAATLLQNEIPSDWPRDDSHLTEFLASFAIPHRV